LPVDLDYSWILKLGNPLHGDQVGNVNQQRFSTLLTPNPDLARRPESLLRRLRLFGVDWDHALLDGVRNPSSPFSFRLYNVSLNKNYTKS